MSTPTPTPPAPTDPTDTAPTDTAILVFSRADWSTLMPELLHAAERWLRALGWSEGPDHRRVELETSELVNEAIDSCLAGERHLPPDAGTSDQKLLAALSGTMRSIAVNRRTSAAVARRASADALDEQADEAPSPSREVAARFLMRRVEQALEDDEEVLAIPRAIVDGHEEREEIAEALGWTVKRVKAVRQRMSRRLARERLSLHGDDTDEDEPESKP